MLVNWLLGDLPFASLDITEGLRSGCILGTKHYCACSGYSCVWSIGKAFLPLWSQETWVSAAMAELRLSDTINCTVKMAASLPFFVFSWSPNLLFMNFITFFVNMLKHPQKSWKKYTGKTHSAVNSKSRDAPTTIMYWGLMLSPVFNPLPVFSSYNPLSDIRDRFTSPHFIDEGIQAEIN